ncbi:hypothetical protein [Methanolacinia petrolearia]|uniref:hypothetical protein n=1 Tax=Methanolacinia petrolearia TaxID=54120 RepID=UPI003BAAAF21
MDLSGTVRVKEYQAFLKTKRWELAGYYVRAMCRIIINKGGIAAAAGKRYGTGTDGQFKEITGITDKFYIDKYDTGQFLQFRV